MPDDVTGARGTQSTADGGANRVAKNGPPCCAESWKGPRSLICPGPEHSKRKELDPLHLRLLRVRNLCVSCR